MMVKRDTVLALPLIASMMFKTRKRPMSVPGKQEAVKRVFNFQFFPPKTLKMREARYPDTVPLKT